MQEYEETVKKAKDAWKVWADVSRFTFLSQDNADEYLTYCKPEL